MERFLSQGSGRPLDEAGFLALAPAALSERCNGLIDSCRSSAQKGAAQRVESFVIFFETLVPTLGEDSAREVKATFFRLVPTLVHMAWDETASSGERARDSSDSLHLLETILLEVSSVRLTPTESQLFFKSLEQLATLLAAGEYALACDAVGTPLLGILRKNRVSRSLFRLMEVEATIQIYLKERFGYSTPQIRVPEDLPALAGFAPIRVFDDEGFDGVRERYLQIQLPDIPILSDIVVRLSSDDGKVNDLRLDGLGSTRFDLRPGLYGFGLIYEPEESRGA